MTYVTKEHQRQGLAALKELVAIPSVLDESSSKYGQPFGKACLEALEYTLTLCRNLGFKTYQDPEGYYGYAEIGTGSQLFGILCHLDVVPAVGQAGWLSDPFIPLEEKGQIIGRGTQDDKGPTMAALFAVKALMDANVVFNQRVRFIFGVDEENLWRCINRYNEKEEMITAGFVPDSKFPLTYAEKGLLQVELTGPGSKDLALDCGGAYNVVPDQASYEGPLVNELAKKLTTLGFDFTQEAERLTVSGRSVHAKLAPSGINAISRLAKGLSELVDHPLLDLIGQVIGEDATGSSFVGEFADEVSGKMTMNVAKVTISETESKIALDFRYPVTLAKEDLVKEIVSASKQKGFTYQEHDYIAPLYVPLDSPLVTTLLSTYREMTGDMTPPFVNGGATFARAMNNCVAFGAMFSTTPDYLHQANEQWEIASFNQVMEIYSETVYRLCCQKD